MVRLFRLARVGKLVQSKSNKAIKTNDKITTALTRTTFFLLGLMIIVHILTCFWIALGMMDGRTWLKEKVASLADGGEEIDMEKHYSCYLLSLYFQIQTITTVGYGDVNPSNDHERLFVIILMFLGASAFSLAAGQISSIMSSIDDLAENKKELMNKIARLNRV